MTLAFLIAFGLLCFLFAMLTDLDIELADLIFGESGEIDNTEFFKQIKEEKFNFYNCDYCMGDLNSVDFVQKRCRNCGGPVTKDECDILKMPPRVIYD